MKKLNYLIINCWSSSIKYQIFSVFEWNENLELKCKWLIEKLNCEEYEIHHKKIFWEEEVKTDYTFKSQEDQFSTFNNAFKKLLDILYNEDENIWVLKINDQIDAIWHRVVHWWEYYSTIQEIDDYVEDNIDELCELSPLHNTVNLLWIRVAWKAFKWTRQFALFDTWFYQTMTKDHYLYAIPYKFYKENKIRKYWFHWLSYQWASETITKKYWDNKKVIVCHLWNWASISAIENWKCVENSLWYTPLDWLIMWSRCWEIDPSIVIKMIRMWYTVDEVDNILNKESWITWILWSWDFRDVLNWLLEDEESEKYQKSKLIYDMYVNRIVKYIWSYIALMNWVDIIAFTWWIWENVAKLRSDVCQYFWYIWLQINELWNQNIDLKYNIDWITSPWSKIKVCVVKANEELVIANEINKLINK